MRFDTKGSQNASRVSSPVRDDTIILPQDSWILNDVGMGDNPEEETIASSNVDEEELLRLEQDRKAMEGNMDFSRYFGKRDPKKIDKF